MKNLFIIGLCGFLVSCATEPIPKVNVLTNPNSEVVVSPPNCPDWSSGDSSGVFESQLGSSFYGCATVTNFGKMVDDPMDMISGKSTDYYDGQTTANAVRTNRTAVTAQ